jgi:hypothetical protein
MIPWYRADEVLDDLALDINEGGDLLRILPLQMGQQPLEVEVHVAPAGLGLQRVLIGYDELAQTLHHLREDAGGDETIVPYFLSPLCPPKASLSASSRFSPHTETVHHNAVFSLDSLLWAGYGYSREQAPGSVLDKAMQIPVQAEG